VLKSINDRFGFSKPFRRTLSRRRLHPISISGSSNAMVNCRLRWSCHRRQQTFPVALFWAGGAFSCPIFERETKPIRSSLGVDEDRDTRWRMAPFDGPSVLRFPGIPREIPFTSSAMPTLCESSRIPLAIRADAINNLDALLLATRNQGGRRPLLCSDAKKSALPDFPRSSRRS
jgi:hypothetical protein